MFANAFSQFCGLFSLHSFHRLILFYSFSRLKKIGRLSKRDTQWCLMCLHLAVNKIRSNLVAFCLHKYYCQCTSKDGGAVAQSIDLTSKPISHYDHNTYVFRMCTGTNICANKKGHQITTFFFVNCHLSRIALELCGIKNSTTFPFKFCTDSYPAQVYSININYVYK